MIKVQKYLAIEIDTGLTVGGYYYCENGYYMIDGKPDINRPTERYYIVDSSGCHREICEDTLCTNKEDLDVICNKIVSGEYEIYNGSCKHCGCDNRP